MSTLPPDDQYDDDGNETIQQLRATIKDQAAQLKDLPTLREQSEQFANVQRENAVYKANLGDLSEAQQQAVLATAKEITADALRSQAELLGFVAPPAPAAPVDDIEVFDRVAAATAGGANPAAGSYEAELQNARNEAEVLAVMARYGKQVAAYD